jgi:hypothetical protein
MSELEKILLTSFLTVISGVFVFVIGRIFERFLIETIHDLRMTIKEIDHLLSYFGGEIHNPGISDPTRMGEAKDQLRSLATKLPAKAHAIPYYRFWAGFGMIPWPDRLNAASGKLIGISNTIFGHSDETVVYNFIQQNAKSVDEIRKLLGIGRHR